MKMYICLKLDDKKIKKRIKNGEDDEEYEIKEDKKKIKKFRI